MTNVEDAVRLEDWKDSSNVLYSSMKYRQIINMDGRDLYLGYQLLEGARGFQAMAGTWVSEDDQGVEIKPIAHVVAYIDGIRHLDWFPMTNGYTNYPSMQTLKVVIEWLRDLELQNCDNDLIG